MPCSAISRLANALEPSIAAARRPGPKTASPRSRSRSASPATSGASGPTTTRSTSWPAAKPASPSASSTATSRQRAWRAMPGLPGAAHTCSTSGLCAIFQASACSRPPPPTRRTSHSCGSARGLEDLQVGARDPSPRAAGVQLEVALPVTDGLVRPARAGQGAGQVEVGVGVVGGQLQRVPVPADRLVEVGAVLGQRAQVDRRPRSTACPARAPPCRRRAPRRSGPCGAAAAPGCSRPRRRSDRWRRRAGRRRPRLPSWAGSPSHSLARSNHVSACSIGGASGRTSPVTSVAAASSSRLGVSRSSTVWPVRGSNFTRSDWASSRPPSSTRRTSARGCCSAGIANTERVERLADLTHGGAGVEQRAGGAESEQVAERVAAVAVQQQEAAKLGGAPRRQRQDAGQLPHPVDALGLRAVHGHQGATKRRE